MALPFPDDVSGGSENRQEHLTRRPSSNYTLSSQAVESEPSAGTLSRLDSVGQRGLTPTNTPVSSTLSRGTKKTAGEMVRSARASASSGSSGDVERNAGSKEAGPAGAASDDANVGEGEKDSLNREEHKQIHWFQAGAVMTAETVSLGILSLPHALATVGYVAGIILIIGIGLLATYTGYVIYQLKLRHPHVRSFDQGLGMIFGKPGLWIGKVLQTLLLIFIMGAHINIFSIMMNTLTNHGVCTVVFMAIGTVVSFVVSMPRTWKSTSTVSIASCISIATATVIAMVAIGIEKRGVGNTFAVVPAELTSFSRGAMAVSNIVLAYNSQIAFPSIIEEMKEARDFPKALAMLQTLTITIYIVVAVVIYHFAGQDVAAPAIGSAPLLVRKIAYGIATPTIVVAGVISAVVAAKQIYGDFWHKDPKVLREKSLRAYGSWYGILAALWVVAWLIAEAIPVFGQLLAVIGALFGTWFALGFCGMFWLWMNWQGSMKSSYGISWKKTSLACLNTAIILMSAAICVFGMYGSIKAIVQDAGGKAPFSCANNAMVAE
ncbi:hypothetical protein LTR36_004918 [Oleoguttula mirabilis]|uniref:Amino acid transporter transmembrane domain-containing protein n=1 Tax=Oleoguttula mirabilis TaxID=1507867 RepID=A0AAV9JX09_9PEZI|nr:hypothetical protein LTR36_004918 [Oleoguttula mirabilis]